MSAEAKIKNRKLHIQFECDECTKRSRWVKLRARVKPGDWHERAGRHLCGGCG